MMTLGKRIIIVVLLTVVAILSMQIAIDQIKLEAARAEIERAIKADLPPGTDLRSAMDYLDRHRYFPKYDDRLNYIYAARGYDIPQFPSSLGRNIVIRGYLDGQRNIVRWEVEAERFVIPVL